MASSNASPLLSPMPQKRRRVDLNDNLDELDDCSLEHADLLDNFNDLEGLQICKFGSATRQDQPKLQSSSLRRVGLTTDNLLLHTQLENPGAQIIMPAKSEQSTATKTRADDELALMEFGVDFKTSKNPSTDLWAHINKVVMRERPEQSPSAADLAAIHPATADANEATVVGLVAPLLFFDDLVHNKHDGEHYIMRRTDINFDAKYVTNSRKKLTTPRPDVTIGYIRNRHTCGRTTSKFSESEEVILLRYAVNSGLLSPFITGQLKSAFGAMQTADLQTTRDGVAIINAMTALLEAASMTPTALDMHHWSITANGDLAILYLHWCIKENGAYRHYMREFHRAGLDGGDKRLEKMRMYLRNILDYALQGRVERLKEVVKVIQNNESGGPQSTFADSGIVDGNITPASPQRLPGTPRGRSVTTAQTPGRGPQTPTRSAKKPRLETPKAWYVWDGKPDELAD